MIGAFFDQNLTWLLGTIGAGILLVAILFASLLVITNLSFAFLSESFEMAVENFKIHLEEWQTNGAKPKYRSNRNRKNYPSSEAEKKPTISTGDAVPVNKKEKPEKPKSEVSEMLKEFADPPEIKAAEKENIDEIPFEDIAASRRRNRSDNFFRRRKTV